MKDKIVKLEEKNTLLSKLLDEKKSQDFEVIDSQKENRDSIKTDKKQREQALYHECQEMISRVR
jgi:hypothetical protein